MKRSSDAILSDEPALKRIKTKIFREEDLSIEETHSMIKFLKSKIAAKEEKQERINEKKYFLNAFESSSSFGNIDPFYGEHAGMNKENLDKLFDQLSGGNLSQYENWKSSEIQHVSGDLYIAADKFNVEMQVYTHGFFSGKHEVDINGKSINDFPYEEDDHDEFETAAVDISDPFVNGYCSSLCVMVVFHCLWKMDKMHIEFSDMRIKPTERDMNFGMCTFISKTACLPIDLVRYHIMEFVGSDIVYPDWFTHVTLPSN